MKLKIRKVKRKDIKEISKIFKESFSEKPSNENWSNKTALLRINYYFNKSKIIVAEYEKRIVGFIIFNSSIWYDGLKGYIYEICISKDFRNLGIGSLLMLQIEKYFKNNKVKTISLIAHKKSKSIDFYNNLKYKKTGWIELEKKL